jgi:hypothetical protein
VRDAGSAMVNKTCSLPSLSIMKIVPREASIRGKESLLLLGNYSQLHPVPAEGRKPGSKIVQEAGI